MVLHKNIWSLHTPEPVTQSDWMNEEKKESMIVKKTPQNNLQQRNRAHFPLRFLNGLLSGVAILSGLPCHSGANLQVLRQKNESLEQTSSS